MAGPAKHAFSVCLSRHNTLGKSHTFIHLFVVYITIVRDTLITEIIILKIIIEFSVIVINFEIHLTKMTHIIQYYFSHCNIEVCKSSDGAYPSKRPSVV